MEMNIRMMGIDHSLAGVEIRELFSFTKKGTAEALTKLKQMDGVEGCVILSTCNRMEIYYHLEEGKEPDIYRWLCTEKNVEPSQYRSCFVERRGTQMLEHLFYLAGGMRSRILGEDQILTQIKEALEQAREQYAVNQALDVLFRMAVTAGKKVKTQIHFSKGNVSAASAAVEYLLQKGYELKNQPCLVIGNGEMGKLTAQALTAAGADVTVTVRQYRSGVVCIPKGCRRINYGERYERISKCSYVFSATASPNLTLTRQEIEKQRYFREKVFVDLAVPRDIDPSIGHLEQVTLYGIDDLQMEGQSEEEKEQYVQAEVILKEQMEEYIVWYECRDLMPKVETISRHASEDVAWRMGKVWKDVHFEENEQTIITEAIKQTSSRVISKFMYQLRDHLSADTFRECMDILYECYGNEE